MVQGENLMCILADVRKVDHAVTNAQTVLYGPLRHGGDHIDRNRVL